MSVNIVLIKSYLYKLQWYSLVHSMIASKVWETGVTVLHFLSLKFESTSLVNMYESEYLFHAEFCISLNTFQNFRYMSCAFISVTKGEVGVWSPSKQLQWIIFKYGHNYMYTVVITSALKLCAVKLTVDSNQLLLRSVPK